MNVVVRYASLIGRNPCWSIEPWVIGPVEALGGLKIMLRVFSVAGELPSGRLSDLAVRKAGV